jgi:MFS family permease
VSTVALGLRANLAQFSLLVAVNALVGGMVGQERTVLPLLAEREFGLTGFTVAMTFIVAFGVTKAVANVAAGVLADRYGRKPVLVWGWVVGLPVPLLLAWAPTWGWVVAANVLLGAHLGLAWSATVIAKIDLAGPERRGFAMGLNEAAGYGAGAVTAFATGWIAGEWGLRPAPFFLGAAYAALGFGLSAVVVRETRGHARAEGGVTYDPVAFREVAALTTLREPALSSVTQAGFVNNLNDGLAWGLFPLLFARAGLSTGRIGLLVALYPAVWGAAQLATGPLSDRWGRKRPIVGGMVLQGAALAAVATAGSFAPWALATVALGLGTALVYPTLLAAIGDVAHPSWRASAVGVYRMWRDAGYAFGALAAGLVADAFGLRAAVAAVAALTVASGLVVAARMYETHPTPSP